MTVKQMKFFHTNAKSNYQIILIKFDIVCKFSLTGCLSFRGVLATPLLTSNIFGGSNIIKSLNTSHIFSVYSYTT